VKSRKHLIGILSAAGAYTLWGILPVYWKALGSIPPEEILAHRIVWSFVFMILMIAAGGRLGPFIKEVKEIITRQNKLVGTALASFFISGNWFTYIWAVSNSRVVEASLGYYINPLVSVMLGVLVLKERLSFFQVISILLAAVGVLNMVYHFGAVPWVALTLAISFGLYGLSKKKVDVGPVTGITLETLMVTPLALIFLCILHKSGEGSFGLISPTVTLLLMGAGIVTAVPLVLFASGAKRLPLYAVGFLQYIAPSLMLLLGVFLYNEPFTPVHRVSFALIWAALTLFSLSKTALFTRIEVVLFKRISVKVSEKA